MSASGRRLPVTFLPSGAACKVVPGVTVLEAAVEAGVVIPAPCGGRGACGRCAVAVVEGELAEPSEREAHALARARADASRVRLACMARIAGPVTIRPLVSQSRQVTSGEAVAGGRRLVAGVDLGTTSVIAQLVDAGDLTVVGVSRVPNRQSVLGADVLSRVSAALGGSSGKLKELAEESIVEALEAAASSAEATPSAIERIVVAGNTAMVSLLAGTPVDGLAAHPFAHELPSGGAVESRRLTDVAPAAEIVASPPVAAFVGGDLVAGVVAEGLVDGGPATLFIDLGTNAEIAAIIGDRAIVASAAAGPAFEGWGISCGGQAGPGGIVRVRPDEAGDLQPVTDGHVATHLTGSGLISAVAFLRRAGHLDADGLLQVGGPAAHRFFDAEGVRAVALGEDPGDRSVFLSQLDVRALQSAKAAVCVALRSVVAVAGIASGDLDAVIVTGAFGGGIAPGDLVALGVLPFDAVGVVRLAPDAAVRGAVRMALEPGLLDDARRFASRATHLDLVTDEAFTSDFLACLPLDPYAVDGCTR